MSHRSSHLAAFKGKPKETGLLYDKLRFYSEIFVTVARFLSLVHSGEVVKYLIKYRIFLDSTLRENSVYATLRMTSVIIIK